jgi:hypothetical protein
VQFATEVVYRSYFDARFLFFSPAENETLAPDYIVTNNFFDQKIKELVLRYNYTLNPEGIYQAIRYMYTYWPDPNNTYYMREKYIEVSNLTNRYNDSSVCQCGGT